MLIKTNSSVLLVTPIITVKNNPVYIRSFIVSYSLHSRVWLETTSFFIKTAFNYNGISNTLYAGYSTETGYEKYKQMETRNY